MSLPRVIFINRVYWPTPAATAQLLTDLAEGLAARGWPVHVIATGDEPGERRGVVIHRTGPGAQHGGLVSRLRNYGRFIHHARRELDTLAQPGDIIVPMTDPPMLGAGASGVARQRQARVVHWIQDIYPEIVSAHFGWLLAPPLGPLRRARNAAWRSAVCCVTPGEDMAQTVARQQVPADRIATVPNWAPSELRVSASRTEIDARRAAWGLTGKFVLAYSGNLGRVHEFAAAIAAAEILRTREEIVLLFIGTGPRYPEVCAAAQTRQLANIRFLPPEPRENLAASLAAADAHLVTLQQEFARLVYPSKLAGALAAGRPVLFVGPTDGEIARLLAREQCGVAVGPADGAALAKVVAEWRDRPERCAQLGRQARATYEKHFTFEAALARWEDILRRAAAAD